MTNYFDASGNILATYDNSELEEFNIYGGGYRLGTYKPNNILDDKAKLILGFRNYELSNHLHNVLVVISDKKIFENEGSKADIVSTNDYYPFGMNIQSRTFANQKYRFGFNGMENDKDLGDGNYTTLHRQLDVRTGRWKSIDPLASKYPSMSPYVAFNNNPIYYKDPYGLEGDPPENQKVFEFKHFNGKKQYLLFNKNQDVKQIATNMMLVDGIRYSPNKAGEFFTPRTRERPNISQQKKLKQASLLYEEQVSKEFKNKVLEITHTHGLDPSKLMAIMHFETGGKLSAKTLQWNKTFEESKTVGLIQFREITIQDMNNKLGTSYSKKSLYEMSDVEQLDAVSSFLTLNKYRGQPENFEDFYMLIHMPAYTKAPNDTEIYSLIRDMNDGTNLYSRNSGLDTDDSKSVTKKEAAARAAKSYNIK